MTAIHRTHNNHLPAVMNWRCRQWQSTPSVERATSLSTKRTIICLKLSQLREAVDQIDQILKRFVPAPPPERRAAVASEYLDNGELRHRSLNAMRDGAVITAGTVVDNFMRDKCLDVNHRELRPVLIKKELRALDALQRMGVVEKIGRGHKVRWRLMEDAGMDQCRHPRIDTAATAHEERP
jgi:hypothetical protein